ncbi:hypothetical protein B0H14DRAFT_2606268 [Mycena olivaceomarginata]|nr:hypothetical protein B0H14DRAFT_2606268 [Mycena olivaceomarginata]
MATISLYTTAPSLAQADGILDTHINILPFSPDLLQTPEPSPSALHSWPPHLILDAASQTVLQLQNTLRALIRSHLPPSTRRLTGLSDDMQFTPYLYLHALALGGLSECAKSTLGARVATHPIPLVRLGAGRPRSSRACSTPARRRPGSGSTSTLSRKPCRHSTSCPADRGEDYTEAHFWAAVLSLESVHRLGAIVEAKRILGDLVQVVYVEVAEAERGLIISQCTCSYLDLVVGDSALDNFTPPTVPISFYIYFSTQHSPSRLIVQGALRLACANAHAATTIMIALDTRSSRSCTQRIPRLECVPPGTAQSVREPHPAQPALGTRQPASQRIETHLVEGGRIARAQPTYCECNPSFHAHPFVEGGAGSATATHGHHLLSSFSPLSLPSLRMHRYPAAHGDGMRRPRRSSPRLSAAPLSLGKRRKTRKLRRKKGRLTNTPRRYDRVDPIVHRSGTICCCRGQHAWVTGRGEGKVGGGRQKREEKEGRAPLQARCLALKGAALIRAKPSVPHSAIAGKRARRPRSHARHQLEVERPRSSFDREKHRAGSSERGKRAPAPSSYERATQKRDSALLSSWMTTGGGPSTSMGGNGSVPVLASKPPNA